MKILRAEVLNAYRSHRPLGFYNAVRGHTGVDLKFVNQELPSPITGKVVFTMHQPEMGNVMYIEDSLGNYHVFAHLDKFVKQVHDPVNRNDIIAITGNTGSRTTAPHLHYEIVCPKPFRTWDFIMKRNELVVKGYNANPLEYLKNLYYKFHIDLDGKVITSI